VTPGLPPPGTVRALLCDADGCLFPSEEPAYVASAEVTNALLAELGVRRRYPASELRREHTGQNFRAVAPLLCREHGVALDPGVLEHWVELERRAVTEHLVATLRPDEGVIGPLRGLAAALSLAVVSSSAAGRVDACLATTGLSELFDEDRRFSAEDSLPEPLSKPDPAIYSLAGERLGVADAEALAVEDSEVGVRSAVAAGFPVIGLLQFVAPGEVEQRAAALRAAGAVALAHSWTEIAATLLPRSEEPSTGPAGPAHAVTR
jgi:HAD superfamily hydrolase (TIGR01509 family)